MTAPNYQAAGASDAQTTGCTYVWPTHQADDIGFLVIQIALNEDVDTPSGWTQIAGSPFDQSTAPTNSTHVFWKRAASSSEANVVTSDFGDHQIGCIFTVRGAITSGDPINAITSGTASIASGATGAFPNLTTTVAECLISQIVAQSADSGTACFSTWVNATISPTEQFEIASVVGLGGGFAVATGTMATAGAIGTTTVNNDAGTVRRVTYISIAVAPPAGAAGSTSTNIMLMGAG